MRLAGTVPYNFWPLGLGNVEATCVSGVRPKHAQSPGSTAPYSVGPHGTGEGHDCENGSVIIHACLTGSQGRGGTRILNVSSDGSSQAFPPT